MSRGDLARRASLGQHEVMIDLSEMISRGCFLMKLNDIFLTDVVDMLPVSSVASRSN